MQQNIANFGLLYFSR